MTPAILTSRLKGRDGLTDRQRHVYRLMLAHQVEHGVPITVCKIMASIGKSVGTTRKVLAKLVAMRLVDRVDRGGGKGRYVARDTVRAEMSLVMVDAELDLFRKASREWARREGRPASLSEAVAGIVEEWMSTLDSERSAAK